jgi:hypothetical protein
MPKNEIDYSSTIIYKIFCKNASIKETYVGHTTNFIKRKYQHKICCNNLNDNLNIYKTIRENDGWDNWEMVEIARYNCKNSEEARLKEQEHYEEANFTLSSDTPYVDNSSKYCEICKLQCSSVEQYNQHISTTIHKKNTEIIKKNGVNRKASATAKKNPYFFFCKTCDFISCNKKDYVRHLLTPKHINTAKILTNTDKIPKNTPDEQNTFFCECGKQYKHRQSLFSHKKKCSYDNNLSNTTNSLNEKEVIMTLLQQNNQLQTQIIELCKERNTTTINNTIGNINSHNKTFNLNVFLNETCKDAMNIMEFVDSLKLQLSDLESVGKLGYVQGISNIIVKNLKALDIHKRPVHCSDSKREVMYIKDENKWEKENEEKNKLRKAIKKIASKNSRLLPEFKEKHPDCGKSESVFSDQYNKLIIEAMGGSGDNDLEKEDKIIRKIAKEVTIDKSIDID